MYYHLERKNGGYDLLFGVPLGLFHVCDVQATSRMQLQHKDHGMFHIVVAGYC